MDTQIYSKQYLDWIKKRFPEYATKNNDELLDLLRVNQVKWDETYPQEREQMLKNINEEVVFDDEEGLWEKVNTLSVDMQSNIYNWLDYTLRNKQWWWDLVIKSYTDTSWEQGWFKTAIWQLGFLDDYKFITKKQEAPYPTTEN